MFIKKRVLTISILTLMLSAPASAFFIDDFSGPQQVTIESNGPTPTPNPTTVAAVGTEIWGSRMVDITLVRGAGSDRRQAVADIASPNEVLNFFSDSSVDANYNVTYTGGDLASGVDFTEGYVLDHIALDILDVDPEDSALATISMSVRLTDSSGNQFSVGRSPSEVFAAQGGQIFFNLEDYDLAGVDITDVTDVRLRIVSGSTVRDGTLDNLQVIDRIPVPGSLLLLLPALALVKRRKA